MILIVNTYSKFRNNESLQFKFKVKCKQIYSLDILLNVENLSSINDR